MIFGRDKFLTEAMGECWHEGVHPLLKSTCTKCGAEFTQTIQIIHRNFSTWRDFGYLWDWANNQEWWQYEFYENEKHSFKTNTCNDTIWSFDITLINPDKFADAVYEYLKGRQCDHTP